MYDFPIWPRTRLDKVQPLSKGQADDLVTKLRTIPPLLQTARRNLDGAPATPARDAVLAELLALERAALDLVRPDVLIR